MTAVNRANRGEVMMRFVVFVNACGALLAASARIAATVSTVSHEGSRT